MKEKIIVLLGPTASGKSYCALELAQRFNGEIISGDSVAIYQQLDIGSAKPSKEEMALVPHHLVDILPPEANFNVVDFVTQAQSLITDITSRGKLPIIAGGTGLYLKALLEGYEFNQADEDKALRHKLEQEAETLGAEAIYARLKALDPVAAERIHPNNVRRVIRALESALQGETVSQKGAAEKPYEALCFGLNFERAVLYERIERRVDLMLQAGLLAEVKGLLEQGLDPECQSMLSIGYRQLVWHLRDNMPYEEAVDKLKQATRNFAKRQITWYKKMPYIHWYNMEAEPDYVKVVENMAQQVEEFLKQE